MGEWVKVGKIADIKPDTAKTIEVSGEKIAVFNVEGEFFAVDQVCPHEAGPLNEASFVDKYVIACPWHGWTFDIRTGKSPDKEAFVKVHKVKVENKEVFIKNCGSKSSCCGGRCCGGKT